MATYSSILAWRIPWTKELGLQSMGCKESDMTEQLVCYSCFTVLCYFPLFKEVNQLNVYMYLSLLGPPSYAPHIPPL